MPSPWDAKVSDKITNLPRINPTLPFLALMFLACLAANAGAPNVFKAQPFDLREVRLLDGPFKHAMELDRQYLLSLDVDRSPGPAAIPKP